MGQKRRVLKRLSVPLCCAAWLIFSMPGCAVWNQGVDGKSSVAASEQSTEVLEKDVAKFMSGVRPSRENPDSIYRRACYFQERKKHKLAIEEFRKVLAADPTNAKAYNGMGVSFDSLGEHSRAVQCYEAALALDSNLHYVYNNLGYSYLLQGKVDSSIKAFEKAIALNEDEKRYHNNLALAYSKGGRIERAYEEFKLGGDEARAKQNMARLHSETSPLKTPVADTNGPNLASTSHPAELAGDTFDESRDRGPYYRGRIAVDPPLPVAEAPTIGKGIPKTDEDQVGVNKYALSVEKSKPDPSNQLEDRSARVPKVGRDEINASSIAQAISHEPAAASSMERNDEIVTRTAMGPSGGSEEEERQVPRLFSMYSAMEQGSEMGSKQPERAAVNLPDRTLASRKAPEKEAGTVIQSPHERVPEATGAARIELSNGNGVRHMARDMGNYLKSKGYKVTRLTNASHFRHGKTTIYYCDGYQQEAEDVAREMPTDSDMKKVKNLQRPNINVKVLIGKDTAPFRVALIEGIR
jgi:lipoprotein NlpI